MKKLKNNFVKLKKWRLKCKKRQNSLQNKLKKKSRRHSKLNTKRKPPRLLLKQIGRRPNKSAKPQNWSSRKQLRRRQSKRN